MITKDDLKKEVDKLPDNLLDEVYALLKRVIPPKKESPRDFDWAKWRMNLDNFSPDFMDSHEPLNQHLNSKAKIALRKISV
jgi:hypothetical protein